jgi:CheY-like chemotaxis protein
MAWCLTAKNAKPDSSMLMMRVLLVDDDPSFRLLVRTLLQSENAIRLAEASGGPQAWDLLLRGFLPDLCVLDVLMPEVSGMELLERMRSQPLLRDIKVILCTAVHDHVSLVKAASLGVHYYFLKPFSPSLMVSEIRKLRDQLENAPPIRDASAVRQRLNLDLAQFAERIESVTRVTEQGLLTMKAALDRHESDGALWCLETLKAASQEIEAHALQRSICRLGAVFDNPNPAALADEIEFVKCECKRLRLYESRYIEQCCNSLPAA